MFGDLAGQDDTRSAEERARRHQERADRRYARLDRFIRPALVVMIAAFLAMPLILLGAAQGWEGVLIPAAIIGVGGALCAGAYRVAHELARYEALRARYERAGVRPLGGLAEFAAVLALVAAVGLLLFGADLAAALAAPLGGGQRPLVLLWCAITAIALPLLIVPSTILVEQQFRAGIDALPSGRSPRAAARHRALIAAAILLAISAMRLVLHRF